METFHNQHAISRLGSPFSPIATFTFHVMKKISGKWLSLILFISRRSEQARERAKRGVHERAHDDDWNGRARELGVMQSSGIERRKGGMGLDCAGKVAVKRSLRWDWLDKKTLHSNTLSFVKEIREHAR